MRWFELRPESSGDLHVEAERQWGLPGVVCNVCGETWGTVAVAYPTVDLSRLDAKPYSDQWPVSWERFTELRGAVLPFLPVGAYVPPGTDLGPLVGELRARAADLAWPYPWLLTMRQEAFMRLRTDGLLSLAGAATKLAVEPYVSNALIEIELSPRGVLALSSGAQSGPPCRQCGREEITRPPRLVLEESSLPTDVEVFRLRDLTTVVIASEAFLGRLETLGLRGYEYSELPVE